MFSKQLFAKRVMEVRGLHHETQKDFGLALGVGQNAISEIENARKTTASEKIAKICRLYLSPPTTCWVCPAIGTAAVSGGPPKRNNTTIYKGEF